MKDKNFKIAGLIILIIGGYFIYSKSKGGKKTQDADIIVSSGSFASKDTLLTFQPEFVSAWSNAVKTGIPTFIFQSKKYSTQGGKAIK
jgi:hypothetical protein